MIEVNNCQVFGEGIHPAVQEQGYELVPDQFYEILLERGVDFDVIGMQMYYGGYMDSELFSGGFPIRHPWDIEAIIKRYTRLGKPIRITEISVPSSYPSPEKGLDFGFWQCEITADNSIEISGPAGEYELVLEQDGREVAKAVVKIGS